ncbi:hypothetical protein PIB30_083279 [Stylosanthes scabra]|uniref:Uncharacterized protein n=1 Tax=Stylosanthes scabra TaxID=79078 RepID=A0ABU6WVN0_9FABA|nr:hypothetical protein [Stylosanthes scabra]
MELIELVANNQYMFTSERSMKRGVMEVDTMDALLVQNKAISQQLNALNKKVEKLKVESLGTQGEIQALCGLCGGLMRKFLTIDFMVKRAQSGEKEPKGS